MDTAVSILENFLSNNLKLTPMMDQYYHIKKEHPNKILFFRMGDFYEVFFEDAKLTSKTLNIALTARGKIGDIKIPMAGIPHHAAATYVDKLTNHGFKVAICEQMEDPKATKGIVKRAVTQVVSPGIPYDLDKQGHQDLHYIASAFKKNNKYYLTALDFSTGKFIGEIFNEQSEFLEGLRLLAPKEFLSFMGQWDEIPDLENLLEHLGVLKTHLSQEYFTPKYNELYIEKFIPNFKADQVLKKEPEILCPISSLCYYISRAQSIEKFYHIRPFQLKNSSLYMRITHPTLTGLEIIPSHRDELNHSLLGFFNKTKTTMGFRKLKSFFLNPLNSEEDIKKRQEKVQYFVENDEVLDSVRENLSPIRDLERILAKISTRKVGGSDLINLSESIKSYFIIKKEIKLKKNNDLFLLKKNEDLELKELQELIESAINFEIGAHLDKGNLIRNAHCKNRDKLFKRALGATDELTELQEKYRTQTGISKLKIKSNNMAGYFIEVSKTFSDKVPKNFTRKQTLTNAERYITDELYKFEQNIVSAKKELLEVEKEIFNNIVLKIIKLNQLIKNLSNIIALTDVYQTFAFIARSEDFSCPSFLNEAAHLHIEDMWHPLIKANIKDQFVGHDIHLDKDVFFGLITGPNMAGKTTVMREVAIIQILAQIGSFVPAASAKLGLCDYLFSRLGASDDILKGQSTFMVEMAQTSEILRHATAKSLIILDEVGRGTSTYDGLSIAWALVEHFIKNTKAITLFATHYHELIQLAATEKEAKNLTVETTHDESGDVQFLYRLIEESASQSYGIYVAKLAGIPQKIINRSTELLLNLEQENSITPDEEDQKLAQAGTQLDFLTEVEPTYSIPEHLIELENAAKKIDIMNTTPLEALNKLQEIYALGTTI